VSTPPQSSAPTPAGGPGPWTGTPFGQPYPPQVNRDDQTSVADRVVFALASMLGGVVAGFAGGAVWAAVADPPMALVTKQGVFFGSEVGYDHRVAVTLWFLVVGILGGVAAGVVVGWLGRKHGPAAVVAAVLMSAVASGLSAWSGIHVFGPNVDDALAGASPGDQVKTALSITSDVAYLGWPIGALLGVLLITAVWPTDRRPYGHNDGAQ
jgi:hypothetical protein